MKKPFIIILFTTVLLTGCTKNENMSVNEYALKMKTIAEMPPAYTLEVNQSQPGINFNYTGYSKGNKWRMDSINKHGKAVMLNDGVHTYAYGEGEKTAKIVKITNPMEPLINWYKTEYINGSNHHFININAKQNGFKCKKIYAEIEKGENATFCVNDKYGIAVSCKMQTTYDKEPVSVEMNIKSIKLNDLPDNLFELPSDLKVLK